MNERRRIRPGPLAVPCRADGWESAIKTERWRAPHVDGGPRPPDPPGPRVVRLDGYRDGVPRGPGDEAAARTARIAEAERGFLRRCVGYLATDLGIRQFVDFGSRVPPPDGVHAVAREHHADARVVRIDTGGAVPLHGRASPFRPAVVRVERPDTDELAARLRLRGLLDPAEPAVALLDTDLLPRGVVAHDVVRVLHSVLAPGSHLVIRQQPLNRADPYARELASPLFEPFELLEPGLADLAWWPYPDDEVSATGVGVLAGVARRR
ncbi:SAM-dependent methyltransferase [Actinorugispora endophytica]|uniref:S-adenosyl methyltransferase n=1 Tax=Actinorugispora endophytica TaxID=1605990 RepID=A0A4R6V1L1_9ACTN|nr:SAM-dependent methyltransferase [Actinorugispora endophytica]TDQ52558.1 S-adenosyl methyltransferase [Actinorugispora endophytica]